MSGYEGHLPPPEIKLYWLDRSRSQRIVWLLEELQTPYELIVSHRDRNLKAPSSLTRIHPLGKAPVLSIRAVDESEAVVLAESGFMTHEAATRRRLDDQAISIFNDVVRPPDGKTATTTMTTTTTAAAAAAAASELDQELVVYAKLRELLWKRNGSLPVAEKLDRFRDEVYPWLYRVRGQVPRRVWIDFVKFARQTGRDVAREGGTGIALHLSSMCGSLGFWDLDLRGQLLLSLCHDVLTGRKVEQGEEEGRGLVRELVELWMHVSQMHRLSQVRRRGLRFVLPSEAAIVKTFEADNKGGSNVAPATKALAGIFNQFQLETARLLVPPLLATVAILSDPLLTSRSRQQEAGPLLGIASAAVMDNVPDEAFVAAELTDDYARAVGFPVDKMGGVRSQVVARWRGASTILAGYNASWKRPQLVFGSRGGGGGGGNGSEAGGPDGMMTGGPSWLDTYRRRLTVAWRSRNPVAAEIIWRDLQARIAQQPRLSKQLSKMPEYFNYWLFIWCAFRRPVQLQETLEVMGRVHLRATVKSYTSMMHGWKTSRDAQKVMAFWTRLVESGERLDSFVWVARISALVECGRLQDGIVALAEMMTRWKKALAEVDGDIEAARLTGAVEPSIEVVNAVYSGLIKRDAKAAREVLSWAAGHGIQANVRTFNMLLGQASTNLAETLTTMRERGIDPDEATFTVMLERMLGAVDGCAPEEQVRAVEHILDVMAGVGLSPNSEVFAKMLHSVASLEDGGADEVFAFIQDRMRAARIPYSWHIVTILIQRALVRNPPPTPGVVDQILREHGFSSVSQGDRTLWESVVRAHAFVGDLDAAMKVFTDLAAERRPVYSLGCLHDLLYALLGAGRTKDGRAVVVEAMEGRRRRVAEMGAGMRGIGSIAFGILLLTMA
ncbi:glutathione S-transferase [Ophiocordyceps camponoti-floridani]|uniref:Glutathione S-transferase n=1 Tax=Ophiocordyceps camponoti-floridani TaxID=2030778 RepID=A0A8H4Q2H6_9HYPO|nr:glutathione S-transferase [Ophiocordyceps camponoti-floridani]